MAISNLGTINYIVLLNLNFGFNYDIDKIRTTLLFLSRHHLFIMREKIKESRSYFKTHYTIYYLFFLHMFDAVRGYIVRNYRKELSI
jgi:hypothetical protein